MHIPNLNRAALIVKPKKLFKDWLYYLEEDENLLELAITDAKVYLIPDFEEEKECIKWLKKNFDLVFIDFLNGWYTDSSVWPVKRDYNLFKEWFEIHTHLMVFDLAEDDMEWF